jgi:Uri superfamily endonuclease
MDNRRGTYALILACQGSSSVQIGRLGTVTLEPGWFVYIGSAFGMGGLAARLHHHLHSSASPRWHLDYLRGYLLAREAWVSAEPLHQEHAWAQACLRLPGATIPLARFGASDCACPAHFFRFAEKPDLLRFTSLLGLPGMGNGMLETLDFA